MRPSRTAAVLALGALAGCGTPSATSVDAVTTRRSFDVVATLDEGPATLKGSVPVANAFTLVLDPDSRHAFVGGKGQAAAVAYTSTDGRTFHLPKFSLGLNNNTCSGGTTLDFTSLDVTVTGATVVGKGSGAAQISCGDCQFAEPFTAKVTGGADVTPPFLEASSIPANPFQTFSVSASEPLPVTATARLVAGDGSHIDLDPTIVQGDVPLVSGFTKPNVVLPFGQGLVVALDGLVDFAGHQGPADTPLRLTSFATPPLVPADGFEGATGATLGGATVISDGPLPPIAGMRSVYVAAAGAPAPGGVVPGIALRVRMAVPSGATTLRFSYRVVSPLSIGFAGIVECGSVGHMTTSDTLAGTAALMPTTWPDGKTVYVTPVATKELQLPTDVTDELAVAVETSSLACGGGPAPPPSGVLIDDLRVE